MNMLGWIIRIVALLFVVRLILRFFAGIQRGMSGQSSESRSPTPREGGRLVRDPQCGTHLPESRAITLGSGDSTLYFCSPACRDTWKTTQRRG